MERTLRCRRCDDVIGAYEPMVVVRDGRARTTSRAAARQSLDDADECYHEACYAELVDQNAPEE
jgi:predicted ATPase